MNSNKPNRRKFLQDATKASGLMLFAPMAGKFKSIQSTEKKKDIVIAPGKIKFAVISINHPHIYGMTDAIKRGGGELVAVYAKEADLLAAFSKAYPEAKLAKNENEILEDNSIQLVLSSGIPDERAPLGIRVMKHGKDYLTDKPGIITLQQLVEVKKVQKETKRIYSIMYSERLENKGTEKASQLVKAGAIGNVIQTINLAPHRISNKYGTSGLAVRPDWFWDKKRYGGILTDIGSHQFDQYLHFTNTTEATVLMSQVGNVHFPEAPLFEDFGDVMLSGNGGVGYIRVDWFTPNGLDSWGDGRLTILGTDGYIEVRKNIDIVSANKGGNHLYLVNQKETVHMDCNNETLPFGPAFVDDVVNRTETAMSQAHCFLATELALIAQKQAKPLKLKK
ncbi:Gfo/Idh/MocA family protein [Lacibacter sediminis]|uniref:Gfo/Idh/MocA family oxidoreductase n=1 Tax=Lacibacter sediminis TaxID=2760713 RepID=A0A7G5XFG8_9BACT|nr:Gfo/Idh/MocA family oxidoreductase [Lacibacter sediminis]QNA44221.1 Gfo/Idh/MocA family oxidoreductase [Lacibacter sediminis]